MTRTAGLSRPTTDSGPPFRGIWIPREVVLAVLSTLALLELSPLLVSGPRETGSRILVAAAGSPVRTAVAWGASFGAEGTSGFLGRGPQPSTVEPAELDIRLGVL